jgi:hypothetical protein
MKAIILARTSRSLLPIIFLAAIASFSLVSGQGGKVTLRANPENPCFDESSSSYLNFDLIVENGTSSEVKTKEVRAMVMNAKGDLVERRFVGQSAPVAATDDSLFFNPFNFGSVKPGTRIRYEIEFEGGNILSIDVTPRSCLPHTRLVTPIAGRLLIADGYDRLSHHRRSGYLDPGSKSLGLTDNFQRFALDFVAVGTDGSRYSGDGKRNEDWFNWRKPVRAAGDGIVAAMFNDQPDNDKPGSENLWTQRSLAQNEMTTYGNFVLIDHGNGEFSLTGHLHKGSVLVKKGDRVKAGQLIAEAGNSGSSLGPHLHYELRTGWGVRGIRNMPPYFHDVKLARDGVVISKNGVPLNTGDVFVAR